MGPNYLHIYDPNTLQEIPAARCHRNEGLRLLLTLESAKAFHVGLCGSVGKNVRDFVLRFDVENSDKTHCQLRFFNSGANCVFFHAVLYNTSIT